LLVRGLNASSPIAVTPGGGGEAGVAAEATLQPARRNTRRLERALDHVRSSVEGDLRLNHGIVVYFES
jgi:hypothetical protein